MFILSDCECLQGIKQNTLFQCSVGKVSNCYDNWCSEVNDLFRT